MTDHGGGWPDPTAPLGEPIRETVISLFAERAAREPEAIAVQTDDRTVTYGQLWTWVVANARTLRENGVGSGDRVAIVGQRGIEFVVSLIATMHAGAVAVPIDADLPLNRRRVMADQADARLVVDLGGVGDLGLHLPSIVPVLEPDARAPEIDWEQPEPGWSAYVFFTSGSTGTPKGALGTHEALTQFTTWHCALLGLAPDDRMSLLRSLSFDAILREVFSPLVTGARIVIAPPDLSPDEVLTWVRDAEVSILHVTPSHSSVWLSDKAPRSGYRLRSTIFSGEMLTSNHVRQWRERLDRPGRILNLYGPTETTMAITAHFVEADPAPGPISVGHARRNAQALVVDDQDRLCAPHQPGEVLLRTPYRTRGYINDAEAQARAFVANPFSDDPDDVVYRTGDLGWMAEDGSLMITGRIDDQVQILGLRVEPAEVAAHLTEHEHVSAAEVLASGDPGAVPRLTAYVVTDGETTEADLRVHLMERLDRPKIPSIFVFLDAMPINDRGKVDRKALRSIEPGSPPQHLLSQVAGMDEASRTRLADALRSRLDRGSGDVSRRASDLAPEDREVLIRRLKARTSPDSEGDRIAKLSESKRRLLELRLASGGALRSHPLSYAQERLWFLDRLEPDARNYLVGRVTHLIGPLDVAALHSSLTAIAERHEILRTRYTEHDGIPTQVIDPPAPAAFEIRDLERASESEKSLTATLDDVLGQGFDLEAGPVWRTTLLRLGPEEHMLAISIHHIASDGWSFPTLMSELSELYRARLEGRPAKLPELDIQYRDYASWQRRRFEQGQLDHELAYWRRQLGDDPPPFEFPTESPRPPRPSAQADRVTLTVPNLASKDLADFGAVRGATPTMVGLAAIAGALRLFAGTRDIVIGLPSADRIWNKTVPLIGFFVNTLPIRIKPNPNMTFDELLGRVRQTALEAYANREVPFERIVQAIEPTRDPGRNPVFQVMFQYGQGMFHTPLDLPDVTEERIVRPATNSKVDVSLSMGDDDGRVQIVATYKSDIYSSEEMTSLVEWIASVATRAIEAPTEPLARLSSHAATDPADSIDWGPHPDVVDAFRSHVDRAPDAVAIVDGPETITYQELDSRAAAIASALDARGVGRDARVAIVLERGVDLIASMLGVLYVGAAFVPLDVDALTDRAHAILGDCEPSIAIVDPAHRSNLDPAIAQMSPQEATPSSFTPEAAESDTDAYIIYTSGSTGTPKGVVVRRSALSAFAQSARAAYGITPNDRMLQFHSPSFDASMEEIFVPLTAGASIAVRDDNMLGSADRLLASVSVSGVTVMSLPTALWHEVVTGMSEASEIPAGLRTVVIGGEAADARMVRAWNQRFRETVGLLNSYGPTETTVAVTVADLTAADPDDRVSIGAPLPTVAAHVVDEDLNPVPDGVIGELCIEGPQLAAGYFRQPDLTDQAFVACPWDQTRTWYRTGDRVRVRPSDGQLEYVGRRDRQVKVRGHRVELQEIEAVLSRHERIRASAVTLSGETLTAHIEADDLSRTQVERYLEGLLPHYMIPTAYRIVHELPRLPSGKLDHAAMARDPSTADRPEDEPLDPATERMRDIWSRVLARNVGPDDDFFDLGGHSLLAVRLLSRIERELEVSLPMVSIFEAPTARRLAARIQGTVSATTQSPAILIKPGTSTPLFCVHAGGGHVFAYQPLADQLAPEQTVYGISAPGVDGLGEPSRTMSGLIEHSLGSILETQPHGPYRLLGWSIGGLIAYESARRLKDMGHEVELVCLLDTVAPLEDRTERSDRAGNGTLDLNALFNLRRRRARSLAARLVHEAHWRALRVIGKPTPPILAGKRVYHASVVAMNSHESGPYSGRVVFFRAVDARTGATTRDEPWRRLAPDIEVVDVPGDHGTLVQHPQVVKLGAELRALLEDLDR